MSTPSAELPSTLTAKQEAFVRAWIGNGHDGSAAVRAAGYDTSYPSSLASQILKSPSVRRRIAELEGLPPVIDITRLTKDDLLSKMAHIAFEDTQAKPADRIAALKALGLDLGLFGGNANAKEDTGTRAALVAALEVMKGFADEELEALIATFNDDAVKAETSVEGVSCQESNVKAETSVESVESVEDVEL